MGNDYPGVWEWGEVNKTYLALLQQYFFDSKKISSWIKKNIVLK